MGDFRQGGTHAGSTVETTLYSKLITAAMGRVRLTDFKVTAGDTTIGSVFRLKILDPNIGVAQEVDRLELPGGGDAHSHYEENETVAQARPGYTLSVTLEQRTAGRASVTLLGKTTGASVVNVT